MPVAPTYPGVYIQEIPSGVHTIAGVATSVAAFIDCFNRGPLDEAVQILSFADFERTFGGLRADSEGSYAIQQFFLNGGTEAWVVRADHAGGAPNQLLAANVVIAGAIPPAGTSLTVTAINEGSWGNRLRVRIESASATTFNMTITELAATGAQIARQEVFRNLTAAPGLRFVESIVNDPNTGSQLVQVTAGAAPTPVPFANGVLSATPFALPAAGQMDVAIDGGPAITINVPAATAATPAAIAAAVQAGLRAADPANPVLNSATVDVVTIAAADHLRILPGFGAGAGSRLVFTAHLADTTVTSLALDTAQYNVGTYVLGLSAGVAGSAQTGGQAGENGLPPGAAELVGSVLAKTGIHALDDVDLFNLLCLPVVSLTAFGDPNLNTVLATAEAYCEERRAFLLVDTVEGFDTPTEIRTWMAGHDPLRHRNAALIFPRVHVSDPLDEFRLRSFGASGTAAGLFARIDSARGVWKAPAGTEATLRNVPELEYRLTDAENGTLNPLAINCLRQFPIYGNVNWGARTLVGSDQAGSEWKYIPVRRLALFLEESLFRGTKWAVFEPNDEPLWAQIRLNVGAFMQSLFRQGAFQGRTPSEAYLVKCDRETTTQNDINNGIVNILVGFAPLKPAEFVIIQIQQLAGQIQT